MTDIKNKISSLSKNKDARILASNFAWLSLLQIAGYLFPLITIPYLAQTIGAEGFGKIAFASAIMVWIQTIADWGFNYTATRDIAQNRHDTKIVSQIFSNVLWARLFLCIVAFVVLLVLIYSIPKFYEHKVIILITFIMVPGHVIFPDWFFQAIEKMRYITILNLLIKLIFTILVFVFIKRPEDYILQPLFTSLAYILCGIISLSLILGKWHIHLQQPSIQQIIVTIKNSTDVFINNLAPNLYNSFSIVILGLCGGSLATGIFDGGNKFISLCQQFQSVISRTFFPFLSRKKDKHSLFATINISIAFVVATGLFLSAPLIVKWFLSNEFNESIIVIRILSVSLIFWAISDTYGINYLIIQKKEKVLRNITICGSIIGLCIGYPLISQYSYIGASITIATSRFILGILTYIYAKKNYNQ